MFTQTVLMTVFIKHLFLQFLEQQKQVFKKENGHNGHNNQGIK